MLCPTLCGSHCWCMMLKYICLSDEYLIVSIISISQCLHIQLQSMFVLFEEEEDEEEEVELIRLQLTHTQYSIVMIIQRLAINSVSL